MDCNIESDRLHIGCGDLRLEGFVNIDTRRTPATDIVHCCADLSFLPANTYATVYSHTFFEHLFLSQREPCLQSIHTILRSGGTVVFLGFPDFREVAQAYLHKKPGIVSPIFDLREVYRYTHGQPEHSPDWWLEQLHKSLFDTQTVELLLRSTGFSHYIIFNYCFRNEQVPLNLGFIGYKNDPNVEQVDREYVATFLQEYTGDIQASSIEIAAVSLLAAENKPSGFYPPDSHM